MIAFSPSPLEPETRLLTVAEYVALGETVTGYTELQEGRVVMSPSPHPLHNIASGELLSQIGPQLPADLSVIHDVDIDLELASPNQPGFSRRPDLVIVDRTAVHRVEDPDEGIIRATEVQVVIEIMAPGSRRTDGVVKLGEYAAAGIPHYWIVDLRRPVALVMYDVRGEVEYREVGRFTYSFEIDEPTRLKLELGRLL